MDQINYAEEVNENNVTSSNVPELKVEKTEVINDLNFIEVNGEWKITSLEIARFTGKLHKDVLESIRNMEPAWVNLQGRKFPLLQTKVTVNNGGSKFIPCYVLNEMEAVYVISKFKDEIRARVVIAFYKLKELYEKGEIAQVNSDSLNKLISQNQELIDMLKLEKESNKLKDEKLFQLMDKILGESPSEQSSEKFPGLKADGNGLYSLSQVNFYFRIPKGKATKIFDNLGLTYWEGPDYVYRKPTEKGRKYIVDSSENKHTNLKYTADGVNFIKQLISINWDISKIKLD